jgi:hypothetical protein
MKNTLAYLLVALFLITILSIVLGFHKFGFTIGFIAAWLALAVGYFYSMKSRDYTHKSWYNDYIDRMRRK